MSDPSNYTIGWICAITAEFVAAQVFLDETHDHPAFIATQDNNTYTLGRIGKHNVVIAVLPDGEYGSSSAAAVARDLLHSFPNVRIGLMVGVGGGAPSAEHDIRLGDVVVSSPRDGRGGVFQYDFGESIQNQKFRTTGFLNQPPSVLRSAVSSLRADFEQNGSNLDEAVNAALANKSRLLRKYGRPSSNIDRLFRSTVVFDPSNPITNPSPEMLVLRPERTDDDDNPAVHYGRIASANQLMKDAIVRDKLALHEGVLCFEMEAAGLMNHFPCLVIRGICDYSDSHKNKDWQGYPAMVAGAYAKALISYIPQTRLQNERKISEVIPIVHDVQRDVSKIKQSINHKVLNELSIIETAEYNAQNTEYEPICHPQTRVDVLNDIQIWASNTSDRRIYWLSGLAGTGKSTIARTIAKRLDDTKLLGGTFFFKRGEDGRSRASLLFSTIARQLVRHRPEISRFVVDAIESTDNISSKAIAEQYHKLVLNPHKMAYTETYSNAYKTVYNAVWKKAYDILGRVGMKMAEESQEEKIMRLEAYEKDLETALEDDLQHALKRVHEDALNTASEDIQEHDSKRDLEGKSNKMLANAQTEAIAMTREKRREQAYTRAHAKARPKARKAAHRETDNARKSTPFLILDALDECSMEKEIESFVPLLSELANSTVCNLKVFVTSRPETAVRYAFSPITGLYQEILLHQVAEDVVSRDIEVFLTDELAKIRHKWNTTTCNTPSQRLGTNWPGSESLHVLVQISARLFIFAATACRFIADPFSSPEEQLSRVIRAAKESGVNDRLAPTYLPVLWQFKDDRPEPERHRLLERFRRIVGTVILLEQPLPVDSIAGLLDMRTMEVDRILDPLSSVVDIPASRKSPVKPFHLSFRDFLLGSAAEDFSIDPSQTHRRIALDCLDLLTRRQPLHYNMFNIRPGTHLSEIDDETINARFSTHLRYACLHWVGHLEKAEHCLEDGDETHQFLRTHFMYWLEALIILQHTHIATDALNILMNLAESGACELRRFLEDTRSFISNCDSTVVGHPLQLYWSVLIFSPKENFMRKAFINCIPSCITFQERQGPRLPPLIHTLQSQPSALKISAMAVSPNSRLIVSVNEAKKLNVWTIPDGKLLHQLVSSKRRMSKSICLAFSGDSQHLIIASGDKFYVYEMCTSAHVRTISSLSYSVTHIDVSRHSDIFASAHAEATIALWAMSTGQAFRLLSTRVQMRGEGSSKSPKGFVGFSDNSELVAGWFEYQRDVYVWDVATGQCLHKFAPATGNFCGRVFSSSSMLPSITTENGEVMIFDHYTGDCKHRLPGRHLANSHVAISRDARYVAGTSEQGKIDVWALSTGRHISEIDYPTFGVFPGSYLIFSDDGKLLFFNDGYQIRIWSMPLLDLQTVDERGEFEWQPQPAASKVSSIHISPNRQALVSIEQDGKIRLWSSTTGQLIRSLEGLEGKLPPRPVALSPDMRHVFALDNESNPQLWTIHDHDQLSVIKGVQPPGMQRTHQGCVVFSNDSSVIAISSIDGVTLWRITPWNKLFYDPRGMWPVVFSATDRRVLYCTAMQNPTTATSLETIKIFSIQMNSHVEFCQTNGSILTLTISPDSAWIATGVSKFKYALAVVELSIWSTETRAQRVLGFFQEISAATFSPDSTKIAVAGQDNYFDKTQVRIWAASTGQCLYAVRTQHSLDSLFFSTDALFLILPHGKILLPELPEPRGEGWSNTGFWATQDTPSTSQQLQWHGYGFDSGRRWITWNGNKIISLPQDDGFDPLQVSRVAGDFVVAWVDSCGGLWTVGFSLNIAPFR